MSVYSDLSKYDSFEENYFKIDDILTTQEKLTTTFEIDVPNMGYLDSRNSLQDIKQGTKLEVPLWLVKSLASRQRRSAVVELPKQYGHSYREIFSADANVVDLNKLGPFYYRIGLQMATLNCHDNAEVNDMSKSLLETFQKRFKRILDQSLNCLESESTGLKDKLDATEKSLFDIGLRSSLHLQMWERQEVEKIPASTMVANMNKRKRKREQMEGELGW